MLDGVAGLKKGDACWAQLRLGRASNRHVTEQGDMLVVALLRCPLLCRHLQTLS